MTLETILTMLTIGFGILDVYLFVRQWKEKNRIKAKEEVWYRWMQSLVNTAAKMQKEIDNKKIQDVKELKSGINTIAQSANAAYVSIKEELKIRE